MDLTAFFDHEFDEHEAIVRATRDAISVSFAALCGAAQNALSAGNKIVFFGNGGSAADSQHLATELVVRYKVNRAPLAAIALTTDSSLLTAGANDFGYDTIFECQVRALGKPGDMAIGITTSGTSANVIRALQAAREIGMVAAALTGRGGGDLPGLADPLVMVPSTTTARIQEMHIMIGHMLCDVLEQTCGR
ncbi:MAG: SIS domain-containing protein [Proteobacteria bacterium]|jgi:D-sedoheptulose 7-phosphate isomerase|nr:SIS domain-containing protein [Pseudomonadota bacterium]